MAAAVLLAAPAWAQEDPCAPGPDGSVPEMCQSGQPVSDTGTVGMEPEDPCAGTRPSEPVEVRDEGDQGVAVGEPGPEAPSSDGPQDAPETDAPAPPEEQTLEGPPPGEEGHEVVVCAFSVPVSAPGAGAPETAANDATAVGRLPRTGPYDRLLALTATGTGLLLAGAGAAATGRRRTR